MAGIRRKLLCALVIFFVAANSAHAFNGHYAVWYAPPAVTSYYYVPAPVYAYYWAMPYSYSCAAAPAVRVIAVDNPYGNYAQPIPAPPSRTGEPPLGQKPIMPPAKVQTKPTDQVPPVIITTRALTGNQIAGATPLSKDRCRVGFWNMTGRDVTLTIEGKAWTLQKNRAFTLDLDRNFGWQVDQRPLQVERLPDGQTTQELVIRD